MAVQSAVLVAGGVHAAADGSVLRVLPPWDLAHGESVALVGVPLAGRSLAITVSRSSMRVMQESGPHSGTVYACGADGKAETVPLGHWRAFPPGVVYIASDAAAVEAEHARDAHHHASPYVDHKGTVLLVGLAVLAIVIFHYFLLRFVCGELCAGCGGGSVRTAQP